MCREALKGYLEGKDTGASPEAIASLVDRHDTDDITVSEAMQISGALREVTVVDPACGSGAYNEPSNGSLNISRIFTVKGYGKMRYNTNGQQELNNAG